MVEDAQDRVKDLSDLSAEDLDKQVILFDAAKSVAEIESEWKTLSEFHTALIDQLDAAGYDDGALNTAVNYDMPEQIRLRGKLLGNLKKLVEYQKLKVTKDKQGEVSSVNGKGEKSALKLKGLTAPQFSGKAEDFASWKERFLALVPKGRSNEEVAALLELSIPTKKVYLLRECQQDDYEGMIDVLQRELAPTRDVINNVKLQLARIKKINADGDKKFIYMVEDLEKISRDLKAVKELAVIANSSRKEIATSCTN